MIYVVYEMRLKEEELDNIKYNNKIMEVRLNDKKRKKIKVGDTIIFRKISQLSESIAVEVENLYVFSNFRELYAQFPFSNFGYDNLNISEILTRIYSIYSPKQEKENGVIAIKFKIKI